MSGLGGLDGDRLVALIGIMMALFLVSRGQTFQAMPMQRRILFGAIWAVILGAVAALVGRLVE